jgi:N-acyl-L-homoserine lactone synthetase
MDTHRIVADTPQVRPLMQFQPRVLDGDPRLLDECYRLRYRVYCEEKRFLDASDYPDGREIDEFDAVAIHVGAVDADGEVAGVARVVAPNPLGYPLSRHCSFFPHVRLDEPGMRTVECSRIMISRHYAQRRRTEPFLTIVKGVMQQAKRTGATHLIGATEPGFFRLIVLHGMPWRVAGPAVDYFGAAVLPCIMSLTELDEAILSGRHRSLERFPVGWDPRQWPDYEPGLAVSGLTDSYQ